MSHSSAPESPSNRDEHATGDGAGGLSLCIVDMNAGHVNQAMRCFRTIVGTFFDRVRAKNPGLRCTLREVSPRDTNNPIPRDCDLYIGSGGPGSPYDGNDLPWYADFAAFADWVHANAERTDGQQKALFGVCHTFELLVMHFRVAEMAMRDSRKFGVMPIYTTPEGQRHPLLASFRDRLFSFEHRHWEAIHLDAARLAELGGTLLAQESRDGHSKGRAILGLAIGAGIETVQFHPEADRAGVVSWIARPDQAAAFRATYGEETFQAMLRTLDDPNRLARTFALVIPGFLQRRFNALATARGYEPIDPPSADDVMAAFGTAPLPLIPPPPPSVPVGARA
jgi:GMP synthase-like glutamine amidotransferase